MSLLLLFQPFTAAIVNNANTTVEYQGNDTYRVTKTGGTGGAYDADAVSTSTISGNSEAIIHWSSGTLFAGLLATDPTLSSSYTSLIGVFFDTGGNLIYLFSGGNQIGSNHPFKNYAKVAYTQSDDTIRLYSSDDGVSWGSALESVGPLGVGSSWYFDSSLNTAGASFNAAFHSVSTIALSPAAGHILLAGHAPALVVSTIVAPSNGHLVLTGRQPSVAKSVAPTTGHLALTGKVPTAAIALAPIKGRLALGGKTPAVALTTNIAPAKGALLVSGHQPVFPAGIAPSVGHISLGGKLPLLTTSLSPPLGHLSLTGKAPAIPLLPLAGHVSLGGKVPGIGLILAPRTPKTGHLFIRGKRPSIKLVVWYPEPGPAGAWTDEGRSGTWAPVPANDGVWIDDSEVAGTWTDVAQSAGNWS